MATWPQVSPGRYTAPGKIARHYLVIQVNPETVEYLEVYENKGIQMVSRKYLTNRIQWEYDLDRGTLTRDTEEEKNDKRLSS